MRNGKYIGVIKIEKDEYICEGEFVEGIKNGDWFIKFPNGKIHAILKYNYDLPAGQWTYFYPNNRVKGYENFENGIISGEVTVYRDNGDLLKKLEYKNGLVDGEMIIYSKNKVLDSIVNFSMGKLDGKIAIYSNNNILQLDGKYKNDKRESLWRLYYNDGNLKMVVAYNHGLKNGRMIVYNKKGQIVQSTIYKWNNEVDIKGNIIEKADNKSDTKSFEPTYPNKSILESKNVRFSFFSISHFNASGILPATFHSKENPFIFNILAVFNNVSSPFQCVVHPIVRS